MVADKGVARHGFLPAGNGITEPRHKVIDDALREQLSPSGRCIAGFDCIVNLKKDFRFFARNPSMTSAAGGEQPASDQHDIFF